MVSEAVVWRGMNAEAFLREGQMVFNEGSGEGGAGGERDGERGAVGAGGGVSASSCVELMTPFMATPSPGELAAQSAGRAGGGGGSAAAAATDVDAAYAARFLGAW